MNKGVIIKTSDKIAVVVIAEFRIVTHPLGDILKSYIGVIVAVRTGITVPT